MPTLLLLVGHLLAQAPAEGPEAVPKAPRVVNERPIFYPPRPPPPPPHRPSQPPPVWLFAWLAVLPAIYAAQRQAKRRREEEEQKTPYTEEDLMNDFEFKILRDPLNRFSRETFRTRILQEESAAGWQLVEVFDGTRMRLKRPPSAKEASPALPPGYDPYRLALRAPSGYTLCIVLGVVLAIVAGGLLVGGLISALDHNFAPGLAPILLFGALMVTAVSVFCFLRARRATRA